MASAGSRDDPGLLNHARKLDTKLAHGLTAVPDLGPGEERSAFASLAVRNLLRGRLIGLPSGQELARLMGVPVLTPAQLTRGESEIVAWSRLRPVDPADLLRFVDDLNPIGVINP
ncbi:MAG: hypothetical protein ACRDST_09535 [Pseudonocardiaceae bacterium]